MAANLQGIVINEILADPTGGPNGGVDTNNNEIINSGDEFVELYNTSNETVNISGWTLSDDDSSFSFRITFPEGTTIAPQGRITVVAQYDGALPPGFFQISSPRTLGTLSNAGDLLILDDGEGNSISAGYGDQGGAADEDFGTAGDGQSNQRIFDGSDTIVNDQPATAGLANECFVAGTAILTERGEVAVETLEIGDRVQTAQGDLVAIKWIGIQTVDPSQPLHPFRSRPIQIKAGALGDNLPKRDLFVSPDHALLVEGLLINAGALENGVSIVATQPEESFSYYHIELEQHSLLIAEGTYAESFLPQNQGRDTFDNGDEYETLYPNHNILSLLPMSFPRVSSKRQLPRCVAKRLLDVAATLESCGVAAIA